MSANAGWVSVGITSDTAEFAVASICCWLERMGRERYPKARELTITADGGGSNETRVRLWKLELQKLADETGLVIHVHHYPPGTSKWNKIEHRLFCHITQNWRGRPLTDRLAVVELIGATTTKAGLKVESALDTRRYQKGIKVSNAAMKRLDITGDRFHPEWNYTIKPRSLTVAFIVLDLRGERKGVIGPHPYGNLKRSPPRARRRGVDAPCAISAGQLQVRKVREALAKLSGIPLTNITALSKIIDPLTANT